MACVVFRGGGLDEACTLKCFFKVTIVLGMSRLECHFTLQETSLLFRALSLELRRNSICIIFITLIVCKVIKYLFIH